MPSLGFRLKSISFMIGPASRIKTRNPPSERPLAIHSPFNPAPITIASYEFCFIILTLHSAYDCSKCAVSRTPTPVAYQNFRLSTGWQRYEVTPKQLDDPKIPRIFRQLLPSAASPYNGAYRAT